MSTPVKSIADAWAALLYNGIKYYIYDDITKIGRSPDATIVLTIPTVSRTHCLIKKSKDNKFYVDDMSNFGTLLNDRKLIKGQPEELHHLDRITLLGCIEAPNFLFYLNKKQLEKAKKTDKLNANLNEKLMSLDSSHCLDVDKINHEISLIELEKSGLEKRIITMETKEKTIEVDEELNLSHAERETREDQAIAQQKMMQEVQDKIAEITKKEEELQLYKDELEKRYQAERTELKALYHAEVEELKNKLEESKMKQIGLEGMNKEVEDKLKETRQILIDCEIEQNRIFEEKMEVETKLETTEKHILDLTKDGESKEEEVKKLKRELLEREQKLKETEKQLKEATAEKERYKTVTDASEEDLLCSICAEIFIDPYSIDCHHTFCKACIDGWKAKKKICPICREKFKTSKKAFFFTNSIECYVRTVMTDEARARREEIIKERSHASSSLPVKKRKRIDGVSLPSNEPTTSQESVRSLNYFHPPVNMNLQNPRGDPFSWNRRSRRIGDNTTIYNWIERDSPVTVAAIDLTSVHHVQAYVPMNTREIGFQPEGGPNLVDLTTP